MAKNVSYAQSTQNYDYLLVPTTNVIPLTLPPYIPQIITTVSSISSGAERASPFFKVNLRSTLVSKEIEEELRLKRLRQQQVEQQKQHQIFAEEQQKHRESN